MTALCCDQYLGENIFCDEFLFNCFKSEKLAKLLIKYYFSCDSIILSIKLTVSPKPLLIFESAIDQNPYYESHLTAEDD